MRLSKKLIQLGRTKRMTIFNPKDGIPLQLYEDAYNIALGGSSRGNSVYQNLQIYPESYSVEMGWDYDSLQDLYAITKIVSNYSSSDESFISSNPEFHPTEYLRIVTGEGDITAESTGEVWVGEVPETFDMFVKTNNEVAPMTPEKLYEIEAKILPMPYHDKMDLGDPDGTVRSEQSNYTNIEMYYSKNKLSDVYEPLYTPFAADIEETITYS